MAISTLAIQWSDLMNYVADSLGMGRETTPASYSSWSSDDYTRINEQVQAGYRQMLWPPPLPGERKAHEWSCLRTYKKMVTQANKKDYVLPDEVGAIIGSLAFGEGDGCAPVTKVKLDRILRLRQYQRGTGRPQHFAEVAMPDTDGHSQMRQISLWPEPDDAYDLYYNCYLIPNELTSTNPNPIFGPIHSETLKQSCLAAAELHLDGTKGEHWDRFMERLRASIQIDRQTTGPDTLGAPGPRRRRGSAQSDIRASSGYYVTMDGETG